VAGNLLIFILGAIVLMFLPENQGKSFGDVILYSLKLLVDSGGFMANVTNIISVVLTVTIVLAGMICFTGGIIAYMSNIVTSAVSDADGGNNKLRLKNHIVIMNWNSKVPLLVSDYMRDKGRQYIVILTDHPKEEVLESVNRSIEALRREDKENCEFFNKIPRVIVRKLGQVSTKTFMDVCVTDAKALIICSPEEEISKKACDSYVIKQFMMAVAYISDYIAEDDENHDITQGEIGIIVELQNRRNERYIKDYPLPQDDGINCIKTAVVVSNEILGKIMATVVINPEIHDFITEVLSFKGSELYCTAEVDEDEDGKIDFSLTQFVDELVSSSSSIPLFDFDYDEVETEIGQVEKIQMRVFLSEGEDAVQVNTYEDIAEKYIEKIEGTDDYTFKKEVPDETIILPRYKVDKSVLIIGYSSKLEYILNEFVKFKENGLSIAVGYTDESKKVEYQNYLDMGVRLIDLTAFENDQVILEAFEKITDVLVLSDEEDLIIRDRIPLLIWNLAKRKSISNTRFYIEVLDPQNCEIINEEDMDGNLFLSNRYVSGLCTQLGADGNVYTAFKEMFTLKSSKNIWSYTAHELFDIQEEMSFSSKKEAILWLYFATDGCAILMGIVRDGISYLLTNLGNLESCEMFNSSNDRDDSYDSNKEFIIRPSDTLIILDKGVRDEALI